jgi:hypothetical protein
LLFPPTSEALGFLPGVYDSDPCTLDRLFFSSFCFFDVLTPFLDAVGTLQRGLLGFSTVRRKPALQRL